MNGRGWKAPIAFAVAFGVCRYWDFDAISTTILADQTSFPGRLITAGVIAGGSKAYGAKKRPRLGRCWSSLPSSLRLCRLRCSSSSSRSLAG